MDSLKNLIRKILSRFSKKQEIETTVGSSLSMENTGAFEVPKRILHSSSIRFEKFYPLAMLLLIALFSSDLTILLFRDSLLPTSAPPSFSTNYKTSLSKMRTEYTPITDRNIFNSDGIIPNPLSIGEGEMFADNGPAVKSQLPLTLIGTIVHINPGKSVATIQNKSNNEVIPYMANDPIENLATLLKVDRRRVIIRNTSNNRIEYIEIPEDAKISFAKQAVQTTSGPFKGEGDNLSIKRSDLNNYLKNLPDLLQQATAVPNILPNGEIHGFKMVAIDPSSVFAQMGLKAGDVIMGVNGQKVDSPAKAMELYNSLRNESNIQLDIERDGRPSSKSFSINE